MLFLRVRGPAPAVRVALLLLLQDMYFVLRSLRWCEPLGAEELGSGGTIKPSTVGVEIHNRRISCCGKWARTGPRLNEKANWVHIEARAHIRQGK